MGILFSAFLLLFRRRHPFPGGRRTVPGGRRTVPGDRRPVASQVCREDGPPGQNHPAAPARALRPGLSRPERVLPATSHTPGTRRAWLPQGTYPPVGCLRPVPWNVKDPPKKPLLSTSNSRMYFTWGTVYIPPLSRTFSRQLSPPECVVKCKMPAPPRTIPLPRSKEKAVKIGKEPKQVMGKNEKYRVETNGHQRSGDLPLTMRPPKTHRVVNSVKSSPAPLDHGPKHPESYLSEKARMSSKSSSSESHGVTKSRSPARDALPPPKTPCEAAVLSAPAACSSLLPESRAKEVLGEDAPRSGRDSLVSGKPRHGPPLSDIPCSSSSVVSASSGPRESKMRRPLSLPLPALLCMDGGEIPVSSKLTCLAIDSNPDTLKIPTCQRNKVVEDKTKIMADCSATQDAPSLTRPAVVADTLPVAAPSELVPATSAKSADLSARPLTKSAPPPLTQNIDHFPLFVRAHSLPPPDADHILGIPPNENGGRLHSAITSTSPISDVSAPAMTSTVSLKPPSCNNESRIRMCVASPPPALAVPTPLPVPSASVPLALPTNSAAVPSTSGNASANPTGQPTSDNHVTDMDTTPPQPSKVFVVTASPSPGRRCRKPQVYSRRVSATHPPAAKDPRLASDYTGGPQTTPRPRSRPHGAQNGKTSLVPATATTNSPVVNSAATHAPVNSASAKPVDDTEPMDTTPAP